MNSRISILGVAFERQTRPSYKEVLVRLLAEEGTSLVVTPNPEMLVAAVWNKRLRQVLNEAALRVVDGVGVVFASFWRLSRYPGVDVLSFLLWEAKRTKRRILIVGGLQPGNAAELAQRYGGEGFSPGRVTWRNTEGWQGDQEMIQEIERVKPELLVVALGHEKQELWLADHLPAFPYVRLAIGVGGAVEFLVGKQHRAPFFLQALGFEWLYRLVREPKRILRIFTAVFVFPVLVFLSKIRDTFFRN